MVPAPVPRCLGLQYRARIAPLLALVLAADMPVPDTVLDEAMAEAVADWDETALPAIRQSLGSLFERRGDGLGAVPQEPAGLAGRPGHAGSASGPETAGQNRLAALLWRHFLVAAVDPTARCCPSWYANFPCRSPGRPERPGPPG